MLTVERFVSTQKELLSLEQDEETAQNKSLFHGQSAKELEKQGVCVTKLRILSVSTGLYGRRVVKFNREDLPNHSFSSGDIAGAAHKDMAIICEGIVSRVGKDSLSVAFEEVPESLLQLSKVCLLKLTNTVTYTRYLSCLKQLEKCENTLIEKLLIKDITLQPPCPNETEVKLFNTTLNTGQREAVGLCLRRSDIAVVHGPPGTGKTTTIIEVIRQHILRGEKVLVCAPSNIAVDNLLTKLATSTSVVRLGHPARVNVNLQHLCLDAKLKDKDEDNILGDVRRDIDAALSHHHGGNKHQRYQGNRGVGELKKELRERGLKLTREVLSSAQVVLCTLTSAGREGPLGKLLKHHFDVCIIDEASQALEVACWIGMLNSKKVILAGDHLQLPPTIKSDKAAKDGLEVTLMERILDSLRSEKQDVCLTLTEQYRMNEAIMNWSSNELYDGNLTAHLSVAGHVLSEIPEVEKTDLTTIPLCYIDTAGTASYETLVGVSRGNIGEAKLVVEYLNELKEAGLPQTSMCVITPYNLQIELIRAEMGGRFKEVEVCTVDGFQGREKEAVVISMVRSNESGEIGFLSESRRMNVAVTRARRHVCLIGDSLTVKRDPFLSRLVQYFTSTGIVKSAFEFGLSFCDDITVTMTTAECPVNHVSDSTTEAVEVSAPNSPAPTFKETCSVTLRQFIASENMDPIKFPNLTSYQRKIVHALCEEMELYSSSSGTGSLRVLAVSKTKFISNGKEPHGEIASSQDNKLPEKEWQSIKEEKEEEKDTEWSSVSVCKQCGGRVPTDNMQLHLLRCKHKNFSLPKSSTKTPKGTYSSPKKMHPKCGPTATGRSSPDTVVPDEGDEALLARARSERLRCPVTGCSGDVRTYLPPCRFCCTCLCSDHQFPESHGCAEAARRDAKLSKPSTSARQQDRNKNRLQQALKEKGKERTKKKK